MAEVTVGEELMAAVNVNVGVLGHVDSGKTSLVRALSTRLSTAALDKHPQSQARGMTLDLGFSSFLLPAADGGGARGGGGLQVTLVDCPGHASLFKTILGGVAIVDLALLVVDVRKGLQPQTVESLVVGALAVGGRLIVALTKTDLVPEDEGRRRRSIAEATREVRSFLERYLPKIIGGRRLQYDDVPIVPIALVPTGSDQAAGDTADASTGVPDLVEALRRSLQAPKRDSSGPFSLAIDHCFAIPGHGTVLTGTVLSGSLTVGQDVELPDLGVVKKVKGIQVFKQPVQACRQGDRVGVRVNGLDPAAVERGVAISPSSMARVAQVVIAVKQVPFFRNVSKSGGKFHATVGHTTVIAAATFFSRLGGDRESELGDSFSATDMYEYVEQVNPVPKETSEHEELQPSARCLFALLQFEQDVFCPPNALVVCSRLELNPKQHHCRLAFYGHVGAIVSLGSEEKAHVVSIPKEQVILSNTPAGSESAESAHLATEIVPLSDLVIGRVKSREGVVDKVVAPRGKTAPAREVIGRDMFVKDVDWSVYTGMVVLLGASRLLGRITGPFGKAGKFRVELLDSPVKATTPVAGEKLVMRFLKPLSIKPPKQKGKRATGDKKRGSGNNSTPSAPAAVSQRNRLLQKAELLYPEAYHLPPDAESENSAAAGESAAAITSESKAMDTTDNDVASQESTPDQDQQVGKIERLKGETTLDGRNPFVVVSGLFGNESDALAAVGRRVTTRVFPGGDDVGEIEKPFGKAGKVRVQFRANGGTLAQVGAAIQLL
jgi:selenocysteine-specific elongation factor